MKKYEMMIVVSGQLPEDLAQEMTGKAKKTVEEVGGLKIAEDFWGRRRLAYKIQGQDHGYYAVFNFSLDPQKITELEAEIKMISEIIRFMVISDDKKIKVSKKEASKKEEKSEEGLAEEKVEEKKEVVLEIKEEVKKVKKVKKETLKKEEKPEEALIEEKIENKKAEVAPEVKEEKEEDDRLEELDKKIDEILND